MKSFFDNNRIMRERVKTFLRRDQGLSIVEYAIAAGLVVAAIAVSFNTLGTTIDGLIVTVIAFL